MFAMGAQKKWLLSAIQTVYVTQGSRSISDRSATHFSSENTQHRAGINKKDKALARQKRKSAIGHRHPWCNHADDKCDGTKDKRCMTHQRPKSCSTIQAQLKPPFNTIDNVERISVAYFPQGQATTYAWTMSPMPYTGLAKLGTCTHPSAGPGWLGAYVPRYCSLLS